MALEGARASEGPCILSFLSFTANPPLRARNINYCKPICRAISILFMRFVKNVVSINVCVYAECLLSRSICPSIRPSYFYLIIGPSIPLLSTTRINSKNVDEILNMVVFQKFLFVLIFCLKPAKSNGHFISDTACFSSPISRITCEIFNGERRISAICRAQQQSTLSIPVFHAA